ncbi:hypothetical protein PFISCL1PPCAC_11407, partial [Pristionchus fissidentatus]
FRSEMGNARKEREDAARRDLEAAIANGNEKKEMKLRMDLGHIMGERGKWNEAIEQFTKVLSLMNEKTPKRLATLIKLVEWNAENGDHAETMRYLAQYEAKAANNTQMCQYTAAWSLLTLYRSMKDRDLLIVAKLRAQNSMNILQGQRKKLRVKLDKAKMKEERKSMNDKEVNLVLLMADIHGFLGERKEAEESLQSALALGTSEFDVKSVEYDFQWSDKLAVAERMTQLAKNNLERMEAGVNTAKVLMDQESVDRVITSLYNVFPLIKNEEDENAEETKLRKEWERLAIGAWRKRAEKKENVKENEGDEPDNVLLEKVKEELMDEEEPPVLTQQLDDGTILIKFRGEARSNSRKINKETPYERNHYGDSMLILAVRKGNLAEVERLIDEGHKLNDANTGGWTALSEAVSLERLDLVCCLLGFGANPNCASTVGWTKKDFGGGITPLHDACYSGSVRIALKLINSGADVTIANEDGWRAFDFLKLYIEKESTSLDEEHPKECNDLLIALKEEEKNAGFVRGVDPEYPQKGKLWIGKKEEENLGRGMRTIFPLRVKSEDDCGKFEMKLKEKKKRGDTVQNNRRMDDKRMMEEEELAGPSVKRRNSRVVSSDDERMEDMSNGGNSFALELKKIADEKKSQWERRDDATDAAIQERIEENDERNDGVNPDDMNIEYNQESTQPMEINAGGQESMEMKSMVGGVTAAVATEQREQPRAILNNVGQCKVKMEEETDDSDIMVIEPVKPRNDVQEELVDQRMEKGGDNGEAKKDMSTLAVASCDNALANEMSAGSEIILVRVTIFDGKVQRMKILIGVSSDTQVCNLPNHRDLIKHIGNCSCEWRCDGDYLESVTISLLACIKTTRPIELLCTVKK